MSGNNYNNDFEKIEKELKEIEEGNVKTKKIIPNGNLFNGGDDPDPSNTYREWERKEELKKALENYPRHKNKIELMQEKRERLKKAEEIAKKKRIYNFKIAIADILVAAILVSAGYIGIKTSKRKDNNSKISEATDELVKSAEDNLVANGLGTKENNSFKIGTNDVIDYSKLDADNPMEVYFYKKAINNSEEFNKFIKSVTYDNGMYCYEDFEQFLRINGYYDQKTNEASNKVFENYMEAAILSAYEDNTLSSYEEQFYSTDLDSQNKTR